MSKNIKLISYPEPYRGEEIYTIRRTDGIYSQTSFTFQRKELFDLIEALLKVQP